MYIKSLQMLTALFLFSRNNFVSGTKANGVTACQRENHEGDILRMSVPAKALSCGIFKLDKLRYDCYDRYWPHVRKSVRCDFVIILFRSMAPGISRWSRGCSYEMFRAVCGGEEGGGK